MHALTVFALLTAAAPANPHLAQARADVAALQYDKAEVEVQAGLAGPSDRGTRLSLLALSGEVNAILGKADAATAAFKELLYLQPDSVASPTWSPKVASHFQDARTWLKTSAPLSADTGAPEITAGKITGVPIAVHDALHLVTQLRVNNFGEPETVPVPADGKVLAPLPDAPQVKWYAELLDAQGGTLLRIGSAEHPNVAEGAGPAATASLATSNTTEAVHDHSSLRPAAYVAGGVGVALLAGSTYFALGASSDRSKLSGATRDSAGRITSLSQKDAVSIYDEGNSRASTAVILGAAGAVAIAAGVGLWIYSRPVTVVPTSNGVALVGSLP